MPLNPDYMLAPSLQMYFVDKDTGLPLSGGFVYFFKDQARTIPKPVFELVSAMPGGPYTYNQLADPVQLSSVGTFEDSEGNDILPYYFPFDSNGNIELYYIEVYDINGVLQFTREAWPNFTEENITADNDVTNFVPNGQFLLHNNVPAIPGNNNTPGGITTTSTIVAQGGWTFDRTDDTTTDIVLFQRYPYVENPTGNPRYAITIETETLSTNPVKDLRLKFPDVNKFENGIVYNLYFEGQALSGGAISGCKLILIKNYGSGGSATTETILKTFNLETSITKNNTTIDFGTNASVTIGPNDDDFLQLAVRFPPNTTFKALLTNFSLTLNNDQLSSFPEQTNAEQLAASTAGWFPTPNHNGNDLYLPVVLTPSGLGFDHSVIGEVVQEINVAEYTDSVSTVSNKLLCDGAQYLTSDYSPLGIPYSRLQSVLFNSTSKVPIYGTGADFVLANISNGSTATARISANTNGSIASFVVDGGNPTNFSFPATPVHTGANYGFYSYQSTGGVVIRNPVLGFSNTLATVGTVLNGLGWVANNLRNGTGPNNTSCYVALFTQLTAASTLADPGNPAAYFTFVNTPSTTTYYVWYQISTETDPAPGGTGIKINLLATDTMQDVANITAEAINGYQMQNIVFNAASTLPASPSASAYFVFKGGSATTYYVWYNVNGAQSDPAPAGHTAGIEIVIASTANAAAVTTATISAINSFYFATPDFRGLFLRGWQDSDPHNFDPDAEIRYGFVSNILGDEIGTLQFDEIPAHVHPPMSGTGFVDLLTPGTNALPGAGTGLVGAATTGGAGSEESRPYNANVNFAIRY